VVSNPDGVEVGSNPDGVEVEVVEPVQEAVVVETTMTMTMVMMKAVPFPPLDHAWIKTVYNINCKCC